MSLNIRVAAAVSLFATTQSTKLTYSDQRPYPCEYIASRFSMCGIQVLQWSKRLLIPMFMDMNETLQTSKENLKILVGIRKIYEMGLRHQKVRPSTTLIHAARAMTPDVGENQHFHYQSSRSRLEIHDCGSEASPITNSQPTAERLLENCGTAGLKQKSYVRHADRDDPSLKHRM